MPTESPRETSPAVLATLFRLAAELRHLDHEEVYVIDDDGTVLYHGVGEADRVPLPPYDLAYGKAVVHNHPHDDISFSHNDLLHAMHGGVATEAVVSPNHYRQPDV